MTVGPVAAATGQAGSNRMPLKIAPATAARPKNDVDRPSVRLPRIQTSFGEGMVDPATAGSIGQFPTFRPLVGHFAPAIPERGDSYTPITKSEGLDDDMKRP